MKRMMLVLLAVLLVNGLCMGQTQAQSRAGLGNFSQRGKASQEMEGVGLRAGHPSLPLGTKARVINPINGKEIEVTIASRIPASSDRVVDLSQDAAAALDLPLGGGTVVVSVPRAQQEVEPPPPEPAPVVAQAPPPPPPPPEPVEVVKEVPVEVIKEVVREVPVEVVREVVKEVPVEVIKEVVREVPVEVVKEVVKEVPVPAEPKEPVNLVINNYMKWPEELDAAQAKGGKAAVVPYGLSDQDYLAWLTMLVKEARDYLEARDSAGARPRPPVPPAAPPAPAYQPPPAPAYTPPVPVYTPPVQVVGNYDRYSSKSYSLQVGAFSTVDGASSAFQLVRAAGFEAVQEQSGALFRVYAAGVPGVSVQSAVQRLGAMGFKQVWVKD